MPSRVASLSLRLSGWEFEGPVPSEKKYVCLFLPHTSNWDALLLIALTQSLGLEMKWMIKDTWLKGPFGAALRSVGAVGIDRSRHRNVVEQMVDEFARRERFVLGIPPEGTRARAEHWKSGFYHIALGARVPVAPGYIDYGRKRAGIGSPLTLTGDARADMDAIRNYYADKSPVAYDPRKFGPIRLREEEELVERG